MHSNAALTARAESLGTTIDDAQRAVFLKDVARNNVRVQAIPYGNQTLQRREGYRQLLRAWSLVRMAFAVHWDGLAEDDAGPQEQVFRIRNVATLYEYWCFLALRRVLSDIEGVEALDPVDGEAVGPLTEMQKDGLHVHLKQGQQVCSGFTYRHPRAPALRLQLYYNLTYSRSAPGARGSYFRPMRPDTTLVVFPEPPAPVTKMSVALEAAERAGTTAHIHFDAKYRLRRVDDLFGKPMATDDLVGTARELDAEKDDAAAATYLRGDLLKMHAYKDAIRRTVGAYVLYPGDADDRVDAPPAIRYETANASDSHVGYRYTEALPGVGAFSFKPGANGDSPATGEVRLTEFLRETLEHHARRFTEAQRVADAEHLLTVDAPAHAVRERAAIYDSAGAGPAADDWVVIGLLWQHVAAICIDKGLFYCRATGLGGHPIPHVAGLFTATWFAPYVSARDNPSNTTAWYGHIFPKLHFEKRLSVEDLRTRLLSAGAPDDPTLLGGTADSYFLFAFDSKSGVPLAKDRQPEALEPSRPISVPVTHLLYASPRTQET